MQGGAQEEKPKAFVACCLATQKPTQNKAEIARGFLYREREVCVHTRARGKHVAPHATAKLMSSNGKSCSLQEIYTWMGSISELRSGTEGARCGSA